jgi:prepilin-type N-terminal cleavage/methylation domain-containing protein
MHTITLSKRVPRDSEPSGPRSPNPLPSGPRLSTPLPSEPRLSTPLPSKPVAQARESAIRECPFLEPSVRARFTRPRPAFTLVELLVVIGIIAMLAALIVPAVMRAQATARNAAIKAEIDMLHMAVMNYKNEYGSFPPCYALAITGTDVASRHVQRLFPRADISTQVTASVNPTNALFGWLQGYTDNPIQPVTAGTRKKLYDFNLARVDGSTGGYYPSGKPGSPYTYFVSGTSANGYGTVASPNTWTVAVSGTHVPQLQVLSTGTAFFNPDTFQILCAGRDEKFGTDDDLSNFWPGTRRDYQDSLNQ